MTAIREPRNIEAATKLAERVATLESEIETVEGVRNGIIASANAEADKGLAPLIEERDTIAAKLASWWGKSGREQALGAKPKQKSIELGGCLIGDKKSRASLQVPEGEDTLVAKLKALRWAKPFLRVKETLDKAAVLKALDGKRGSDLKSLGFDRVEGADEFFIKRAEQGQTRG